MLSLCISIGSGPVGNVNGLNGAVQEAATVTLIVGVSSLIVLGMFTL